MVQASFALLLVFFIIVGFVLFLVYGARAGKVQFSLGTIFIAITTTCVCMAFFAAFGVAAFQVLAWLLMLFLPIVNSILVALLLVTVIHRRNEQQAVAIGRLVPLVGLATSDAIRLGGISSAISYGFGSWVYFPACVAVYLTALASGYVCSKVFRNLKRKPSLTDPHDYEERTTLGENLGSQTSGLEL